MSKELSNGELVQKIREQLNKDNIQEITTEEENELETMQRILMGEIRGLRFPDKIKRHFMLYFGIPQESPEKLQLDQLMFKLDSIEKKHTKEIDELRQENKQEQKMIRYIIIALGTLLGFPEIIRFLGFG